VNIVNKKKSTEAYIQILEPRHDSLWRKLHSPYMTAFAGGHRLRVKILDVCQNEGGNEVSFNLEVYLNGPWHFAAGNSMIPCGDPSAKRKREDEDEAGQKDGQDTDTTVKLKDVKKQKKTDASNQTKSIEEEGVNTEASSPDSHSHPGSVGSV